MTEQAKEDNVTDELFLGIDIGTQGVRALAADAHGRIADSESLPFKSIDLSVDPKRKEQSPHDWWETACLVLRRLTSRLDGDIAAVSLDATSGTVVPVNGDFDPVCPALMYNDARSKEQAARLSGIARAHEQKHGYAFNSSYALPKIMWCIENGINAKYYITQTDHIMGKLTGDFLISDFSSALKTGYDLIDERWPDSLSECGVDKGTLPAVTGCGMPAGSISAAAEAETGIKRGTPVRAGATDGYASALAAGLSRPGKWASVLGTTLVIKGITEKLVCDPRGRIYSHKHPQGWWMPGGASNTGGRYFAKEYERDELAALDKKAAELIPTEQLCYPLAMTGERFPFVCADAQGFYIGEDNRAMRYASALEGVGFIERMCYELLEDLGCEVGGEILSAGGGSRSPEWLRIRAAILGKTLLTPAGTDAAMGSAMLASVGSAYETLADAVEGMCVIGSVTEPDAELKKRYDDMYARFIREMKERYGEYL